MRHIPGYIPGCTVKFWWNDDSDREGQGPEEEAIDLADWGLTEDQWRNMDEQDRLRVISEWALQQLKIGWKPLE